MAGGGALGAFCSGGVGGLLVPDITGANAAGETIGVVGCSSSANVGTLAGVKAPNACCGSSAVFGSAPHSASISCVRAAGAWLSGTLEGRAGGGGDGLSERGLSD